MYASIHTHSAWSLMDATNMPFGMTKKIASLSQRGFILTDHGTSGGFAEISKAGKKNGVKVVCGNEMYVAIRGTSDRTARDTAHLTLWAFDKCGYHNLLKLHELSYGEAYYYNPRTDFETLAKYSEGLGAASGCLGGVLPKALVAGDVAEAERRVASLSEIFPGRFWIEVQNHLIPEELAIYDEILRIAKKFSLPIVAAADSHYTDREDWTSHDIIIACGTGSLVRDPNRKKVYRPEEFFLKSEDDMLARHEKSHVLESGRILDMCDTIDLSSGGIYHLPSLTRKPEIEFRRKVKAGIAAIYGNRADAIERAEYEMDAIVTMGFVDYFLVVSDIYDFMRAEGIPFGLGRGSAAGSIACYALGITGIDPLKYNLIFERFINPSRVSLPDIDMDVSARRRGEIIAFLRSKYGNDHVMQLPTFTTLGGRAAIRDVGRTLAVPLAKVDALAKMIPLNGSITRDRESRDYIALALKKIKSFKQAYESDEQCREIIDEAMKIEGLPKAASMHAAGIVIADKPISDYAPIISVAGDEGRIPVLGYDMNVIEDQGLIKMDLLGLKTLDCAQDTIDSLKKAGFVSEDFSLASIPLDDPATFSMLARGLTAGVFQLESVGMRQTIRELKPDRVEDIMALVAMYRPGFMSQISSFIARKHGREKVTYPHPSLEPVLKDTYGLPLYQEELMQLSQVIAGYSMSRADSLRKTLGKKVVDATAKEREDFVAGAVAQGHKESWAADLFNEFIEPATMYSFNSAHSAAYGMLAYQTAYLKANFPLHFFRSLLTVNAGDTDKTRDYIADARSQGVPILPPDVNESSTEFTVLEDRGVIRYGLPAIKNCGGRACALIINRRKKAPYTDIFSFVERTKDRLITSRTVESLVLAGAFDSQPGTRLEKLASVSTAFDRAEMLAEDAKRVAEGRPPVKRKKPIPEPILLPPDREIDLLAAEREHVGTYISSHPYLKLKDAARAATTHSLHDIRSLSDKESATICGIVTNIREHLTKKGGKRMLYARIEDDEVCLDVTVFPKAYEGCRDAFILDQAVVLSGSVGIKDEEGSGVEFFVDSATALSEAPTMRRKMPLKAPSGPVVRRLPWVGYVDTLDEIKSVLGPGNAHLVLPNGEVWEVS